MRSHMGQKVEEGDKCCQPLILIVDNDPDNLLLASYVIESLGMRFIVTDDSEQCLNLVNKFLPDLILLDIVMPNLNGLEITRLIRRDKNISHTPIIAVTGLTKAEDKRKLMAAGCDDYLRKPYLLEELEFMLDRFINYPLALVRK